MASSSGSTDFLQLYGDNTKELYTERFYDAMDNEHKDLQNYHHKYKSKSWRNVVARYNISLLLNYWLYGKLIGIYGPNDNELIRQGFSALQLKWDTFDSSRIDETYYKKCKPNLEMVNHTNWDKRKELYDYYVDYDTIYPMAIAFDNGCKYYKKIEEKKSLYEYFERECLPPKTNCPDFYVHCKPYKPDNVLPSLKCHAQMQKQIADAENHGQSPEAGRGPSEIQAAPARTQDTQSTSQSSDIGTKVSHSVLGAAPVLLTATMLYRYTPLGPWIRRFGGGRTNSMNAMHTFSPYTQETGDMLSEETANYISYQPI